MKMKKILSVLLVAAMTISLAACGGNKDNNTSTNSNQGGTDATPSTGATSMAVCIASEPDTLDPALNSAVDGATMCIHLFSGLAKWNQDLQIVPDAAVELPEGVENADGTITYTYTLRDGMQWSDGQPVTANDFEFAWKRASSEELAADYGYMMEVIKGYNEGELAVTALDEKTLEVTLYGPVSYWNELLSFPTYFPVREDVVSNEAWATDPSTYVSNGMYKMTAWEHNSVITLEKNEGHPDADQVTMDTLEFYLSDDANNMLSNFQNGSWQLIDDVPTNEIASLKDDPAFNIGSQMGTYYVCWNVNEELLPANSGLKGAEAEAAKAEIRKAISLLLDRTYIVEEIGQAGQVPASSFVALGLTDTNGKEFYENAGDSSSYVGYFDASQAATESNFASAVETLKKYYEFDEASQQFTNVPTLTYIYNTSEGHQKIGEYIQSAVAAVGINMELQNEEWNSFLNTRKQGNYSVARNGWLADYNDPISFLDMWTTGSGNNDIQYGRGAHESLAMYSIDLTDCGSELKVENGTWAETFDACIAEIKACRDNDNRYKMMHKAEDLLMSTGCITPLYYYTDIYMLDAGVSGFFANPLGYKYFMYCTL